MRLSTNYNEIYNFQLNKFRRLINRDYFKYKEKKGNSPFPILDVYTEEYYIQKYFEKRFEYYFKNEIANGILGRMLEYNGHGIYYPDVKSDNEIMNIEQFENKYHFEYILDSQIDNNFIAFRYTDIDSKEIKEILKSNCSINEIHIIKWDKHFTSENEKVHQFFDSKIKIRVIGIYNFFIKYFNFDEYYYFIYFITSLVFEYQNFLGIKNVVQLHKKTLGMFRFEIEKNYFQFLKNIENNIIIEKKLIEKNIYSDNMSINYGYHIINSNNLEKYPNIEIESKCLISKLNLINIFKDNQYINYLLGLSDFAKSFLTSEYMYIQHNDDYFFDYTSIVSGYLKSIEQLLFEIMMLYKDKGNYQIKYKAFGKNIFGNYPKIISDRKGNKRIYLKSENLSCIDTTLNSLIQFFSFYKETVSGNINNTDRKIILNCLNLYRDECRNGAFHKENILDKAKVEKIRLNTLFLYLIIFTCFNIENTKSVEGNTFFVVKNLKFERLYYCIMHENILDYQFIMDSDLVKKINVRFVGYYSEYPIYNEYGLIETGSLKFENQETKELIDITKQNLPLKIIYKLFTGDIKEF